MSNHDIELPPLPKGDIAADTCPVMWVHSNEQLQEYARAAIEADRQRRGEPEGWKLVPVEPDDNQWGNLARDIIKAWDFDMKRPRELFEFLEHSGTDIPQWLRDEPEMKNLDHMPSKGTRAVLIYKAMLEAAPKFGEEE